MQQLEGRLSRAATAGEYFVAELVEPAGLSHLLISWPDDVDLTFERGKSGTWMLSGMVPVPKLHKFVIHGQVDGQPVTVNLRLPVSPDPWSMWKDLPVNWDTLPYPKLDTARIRTVTGHIMIGASRRGRSHAHKARPRDDDMRVAYNSETGWHTMAVADGAGSAEFSRAGAELAVKTAVEFLNGSLPADPHDTAALSDSLTKAMIGAAEAIEALSKADGHPLNAFNTTLLVAVAKRVPEGWFLGGMSVGDGLIGVIAENEPPLMMIADHGEYAGQTVFLRRETVDPARICTRVVADLTAFMAMTDGVSDPMFASQSATNDPAAWAELLTTLEAAGVRPENPDADAALLEWLNFKVKGEHDDRTITILYPGEGTA